MSQCFYRELEANNITFLPEGLFDNLINLMLLWVNTSLLSLSNKLKRLSPKEPRDQPEVIRRTQGLKTSNSEEKFIFCCQILLCFFLKVVIFSRTQVIWGVMCYLYKVILLFFIAHTVQVSCTFKKWRIFLYSLTSQEREKRPFNWQTAVVTVNTVFFSRGIKEIPLPQVKNTKPSSMKGKMSITLERRF